MFNVPRMKRGHSEFIVGLNGLLATTAFEIGRDAVQRAQASSLTNDTYAKLGSKFRVVRIKGGRMVRIHNNRKRALWTEKGTADHEIRAKPGKFLRFPDASGNIIFRAKVHVRGIRATWFLRTAAEGASGYGEQRLRRGSVKLISKFNRA